MLPNPANYGTGEKPKTKTQFREIRIFKSFIINQRRTTLNSI